MGVTEVKICHTTTISLILWIVRFAQNLLTISQQYEIFMFFFIVLLSKLDHWSPRPQRNNRLKDKEQRNLQFPQLWKQLHKPWFHPPSPFPIFKAQFYIILYKFCICSKSGRCLEWDLGKNEKENKFRYIKRSALSGISSSLFYKQISKCELHIKSCYLQHFLG